MHTLSGVMEKAKVFSAECEYLGDVTHSRTDYLLVRAGYNDFKAIFRVTPEMVKRSIVPGVGIILSISAHEFYSKAPIYAKDQEGCNANDTCKSR